MLYNQKLHHAEMLRLLNQTKRQLSNGSAYVGTSYHGREADVSPKLQAWARLNMKATSVWHVRTEWYHLTMRNAVRSRSLPFQTLQRPTQTFLSATHEQA
jgi:hypothetical protein